jgi:hypothetical protein
LVEQGLAAYTRTENIRLYRATDPRNLVRWIEEKKKNVETLIPNLLAHQAPYVSQEAEVFEGIRGFKAMAYNFIEGAEPGDDYLFFSFITKAGIHDDEVFAFYRGFTIDRQRRGLIIKGISHVCQRGRFLAQGYNPATVCFVEFPTLQNISICKNKVFFTPWDEKQVSFMVTSKQLAENYRDYFYSVWNYRSPRSEAA